MTFDIFRNSALTGSHTTWLALAACVLWVFHRLTRRNKLLVQLPGPNGGSWTTGHFRKILGLGGTQYQEGLVATYGPTIKLNGAFGEELIWTLDPAAIHSILVKDRAKFKRPEGTAVMLRSIFGGGLLAQTGDEHRVHRKLLNPVFTMKFLRDLMPIFMGIAEQTCMGIKKDLAAEKASSKEVDVFPWATVAALELIGEAGLGYSFSSFTGERNEYNIAIKSATQSFSIVGPFIPFMPFLYRLGTPALRRWALKLIPSRVLSQLLRAIDIQNEQAEEVLRSRQNLISSGCDLSAEAGRGRDIMTLLMKANEAEGSETHIDRQAMVGHMNTFVFAGHETTSTAVSRILDVLADHPQVQVKLREEIGSYFKEHSDDVNHEGLLELPYLDAVVRETLRMYGPVTQLSRMSTEDTVVPLAYPIDTPNGKMFNIPIKKGTRILLSITMSNRYDKIWGERAHEFWPERWVGAKVDEVTLSGTQLPGVYSSMMTFGAGSNSCIGFKFAILEIKVMIAALLKTFKFEPSHDKSSWEVSGVQLPYLQREQDRVDRIPKLPLRVIEI